MPTRIQRRRTKGWRAPAGARYVGRGTRYGNPWVVVETGSGWSVLWTAPGKSLWSARADSRATAHDMAVGLFREYLREQPRLVERARRELAGVDLLCWCPPELPCHADVLLAVARGEEP